MIDYNFEKLKTGFTDSSVKNKLMIMILTVSVVCTILTVLSFSVYGILNMRKEMRDELSITGTIISNRIDAALVFKNNSLALETLSALSANSSIQIACVYDVNGNVFAKYYAGKLVSTSCPSLSNQGIFFHDNKLQLYKDITDNFNNDLIGTLYIASDLNKISSFINKQIMIALSIIIMVMAIGYILAVKLQRIISQPIRYLVNENEKIGELLPAGSTYFKSGNELVKLQSLFNAMQGRIEYLEYKADKRKKEMQDILHNSETTFSYLNNELKQPLESTIAFGDIINSSTIGKIDNEYISYFNDVYLSVYYYYGIMNDSMTFFKKHLREYHKKSEPELEIVPLLKKILKKISNDPPEYLQRFDFKHSVTSEAEMPKMLIDKFVLKEIIINAIFVYTKYLAFLKVKKLTIQLNTHIDDSDPDSTKFKIDIICKEMQNENIADVMDNHREYQNDVHLIRAKLQFLKYLASYNGAYLDLGNDMRYLFKMVLMFPYNQILITNNNNIYENYFVEQMKKYSA